MCVCVLGRERENVLWEEGGWERERKGERECVCVLGRGSERESVCVCVFWEERERRMCSGKREGGEKVCVLGREGERECVCVCVFLEEGERERDRETAHVHHMSVNAMTGNYQLQKRKTRRKNKVVSVRTNIHYI